MLCFFFQDFVCPSLNWILKFQVSSYFLCAADVIQAAAVTVKLELLIFQLMQIMHEHFFQVKYSFYFKQFSLCFPSLSVKLSKLIELLFHQHYLCL